LNNFRAVDGISFSVGHGESVGLVGEIRLWQIHTFHDGDAAFGPDLRPHHVRRRRDRGILPNAFARLPLRKSIQMVFQDPTDSLKPALYRRARIVDPIMQLATSGTRRLARPRRELAGMVGCRSICWIVSRINVGRTEGRVGIARPSRYTRSSSFSTSRPRRSMSRCRPVVPESAARLETVDGHELFCSFAH